MSTENLTPEQLAAQHAQADAAAKAAEQAAAEKLAAAQAAATATQAAEQAAAEKLTAEKAAADAAAGAFEETGDPALDVALGYAAQQGLRPDSPEIVAAKAGDFAKLEAYLKERNAPGYEKHVALARGAYDRAIADGKAKNAAIDALVEKAAGGKDQWVAVKAHAVATLTPEQRAEVNAALAVGGFTAQAVANQLVQAFRSKGTYSAKDPAPTGGTGTSDAAIGAREYGREVEKLVIRHKGKDVSKLPEYQALVTRRKAGRASGIA